MPYLIMLLIILLIGTVVWFIALLFGWGNITISWDQQQHNVPIGALCAVVIFSLYPTYIILHCLIGLIRLPQFLQEKWQKHQNDKGLSALTQGLIAVAADDKTAVEKYLHTAESHLQHHNLLDLLRYYHTTFQQDKLAQEQLSTKMLDKPELRFLGIKGLLIQSVQNHETSKALQLARQAYAERPTSWLVQTIVTLLSQQQLWEEAYDFLKQAYRKKQIAKDIAYHWLAVLGYEIALKIQSFDQSQALKLLRKSCAHRPDLVVLWIERCRLYHQRDQKPKKTIKYLQQAWEQCPHPILIVLAFELLTFRTPLDRLKAVRQITLKRPDHPETLLALAQVSIQTQLWGDTENYLQQLDQKMVSPRLYLLWAEFTSQAPHKISDLSPNEWLKRAATCSIREGWFCGQCDTDHDHWQPLCRSCQAFASIEWEQKSMPWPRPNLESSYQSLPAIEGNLL